MHSIKTLIYGPFSTEVILTGEVKEFFQEESESAKLSNLTSFDSDEWYQVWLLKYLDKDKDGIPDPQFKNEFKLIYTNVIQNPEDYQDIEDILEELNIPQENLIFEGSKTIFEDNKNDLQKTKFWVRWIVVKK